MELRDLLSVKDKENLDKFYTSLNADSTIQLTDKDKKLLDKHLNFYESLYLGRRTAKTEAQKHFVKACKGSAPALTDHEKAYQKYLAINRKKYLQEKNQEAKTHKKKQKQSKSEGIKDRIKKNAEECLRVLKRKQEREALQKNQEAKTYEKKRKQIKSDFIKNRSKENAEAHLRTQKRKQETEALRKKQNAEAYLRMLNRKREREALRQGGIPEYEEGYPRPGWFTDEDWKKMRAQDYSDMKNRSKG